MLNAQQFESEGTVGQAGGSGGATAGSRGFAGGAGRTLPPSAEQQASGGRVYDQGDSGSRVSSGRQGFTQQELVDRQQMQDASPEEIWERYSQAKSSSQFFQLSFLFFLGLIPAFIMLGGFKFAIFMALPDIAVSDLQLTCLGIGGAFLTCLARFFFTWIAETQIISAKTLLSLCLFVQFGTLLACHYYPHDTLHRAAILALYTVTCTVYGAIICLVPTLCSQVFGPAQLSAQGLLFEQSSSIQI